MKKMFNNFKNNRILKGLLVLVLVSLISCNAEKKSETAGTNDASENADTDSITITESQFKASNMELGKLTLQDFSKSIKANGMFDVPPQNKATVSAYFAGYVKNITLLPGDVVKKGQVLFTLENPEYVQMQQDFLEAKGRLNYLKSDYDRQKLLLDDNVTSQKNYLKAESEYKVTLVQFQSLKKKLGLMNINANTLTGENISSVISVLSPLSGFATTINASKGMFLNPSDVAMTITNTEQLHIELKIFEKDLPSVKVGQSIKVMLQNEPGKVYEGKVHLINRAINAAERTIDIHGDLVNKEDAKLFAPGMYLEAAILTATEKFLALPQEAVANIENDFFVLVKQNTTSFKRMPVKIGATDNGYVQILNAEDFDANTEFLTKGAFNLISE
ncbi:MAG: efflux RND transporter periplasmic adaptor subunit [Gelidibacter sp.]|nr:efflux RND transporter periplasmic adaptor subunit [Gelidibacter sp.]